MSQEQLYTIEAASIPSRSYSVSFREPLFKDRREASRRMPNDDVNLGYTIEQLLLSSCLEQVNGQPYQMVPRDPIAKLRELPPADTQFLVAVFLEMFTLNEELAEEVKALSEELRSQGKAVYTIPKEAMPSGLFSISFKQPTTGDQIDADRRYPGAESNCGYSMEEMLFASSLSHINGELVQLPKDTISLLDPWTHLDAQFALAVFLNLCFIDRSTRMAAKDLGKQLRRKERTLPVESKKQRATTTTN